MSLLVDISAQALDPGYAVAARRRGVTGAAPPTAPRTAFGVLGVLVATLVIVLAAVQAHEQAPAAARLRQTLLSQVQHSDAVVARLQHRADQLRRDTIALRDRALGSSDRGAALSRRLARWELLAGTAAAGGPGLLVRLDDAAGTAGHGNRVTDLDLQSVVNALWAAGAEAVAVNGERLTAQSAIRQAGSAILANFQPLAPPYVISAIGDPVQLETRFGAGRTAAQMRALSQLYGLQFRYSRSTRLRLPAAAEVPLRDVQVPASAAHGPAGQRP